MCRDVIDLEAIDDAEDYELFDLHDAFRHFNEICFDQTLEAVCVSWSKRLTLTAGKCQFKVVPNKGAYIWLKGRKYCEIRLSEPLLMYRSAKECKETLLHEMIHAHLFLTKQNRDIKAHGKEFLWHMRRVNEITGLNVTVYHDFHDEVEYHRRHVWRCSGPCRLQPPYFGYLRRARNVAPGPRERWWRDHQALCGGEFHKIAEPVPPRPLQAQQSRSLRAQDERDGNGASNRKTVDVGGPVVIDLCDDTDIEVDDN